MSAFALTNTWKIEAPLENCWFCLLDREQWPLWWDFVDSVEPLQQGDLYGIGDICKINWHTCLPYRLSIVITTESLSPYRYIHYTVSGDLTGTGRCRLKHKNNMTWIHFGWYVSPQKNWMKMLLPYASFAFRWNHQQVMKKGEQSFKQRLYSTA